ncbi:MAG TPA: tetratricopeptide repeat protein [Pyrinomonadaceae bacterium]|nr:tetratricopeptide repeat protein [Pyrinomonadaceae bacterium]
MTKPTSGARRRSNIVSVLIILAGLFLSIIIVKWMDEHRPATDSQVEEEQLYLSANTVKRLSLGFNGLAADWYWMRSLQYVGRKIINNPQDVEIDNLGQLDLRLLAPLLDTATTLDPQFMEPYQYAAVVLPDIDVQESIRIIKKGMAANPSAWRLYQNLGYIYWQQGDFEAAAETYDAGSKLPGAPVWMEAMKAKMIAEGGSRSMAREIYLRMFEQTADQDIKEMARRRVMQLDFFDQRDALRKLFWLYKDRTGACPSSWKDLEPVFRSVRIKTDENGAPLDPSGAPYRLLANCDTDLSETSKVPRH